MSKFWIGFTAGIFAGAFARELLQRRRPDWIDDVRRRARERADQFRDAFREGYDPGDIEVDVH